MYSVITYNCTLSGFPVVYSGLAFIHREAELNNWPLLWAFLIDFSYPVITSLSGAPKALGAYNLTVAHCNNS